MVQYTHLWAEKSQVELLNSAQLNCKRDDSLSTQYEYLVTFLAYFKASKILTKKVTLN